MMRIWEREGFDEPPDRGCYGGGGGGSSSSSTSSQTQQSYDQRAGATQGSIAASGGATASGNTINNQSYNITASSDPQVVMAALAANLDAETQALQTAQAVTLGAQTSNNTAVQEALAGELATTQAALNFGSNALDVTTAAVQSASPQADYQKLVLAGAVVLVIFFLSVRSGR